MVLFFVLCVAISALASDDSFFIENNTHAENIIEAYKRCIKKIDDKFNPDDNQKNGDNFSIQACLQTLNSFLALSQLSELPKGKNSYNRMFFTEHLSVFDIPCFDAKINELSEKPLFDVKTILSCLKKSLEKRANKLKHWLVYSTEQISEEPQNPPCFLEGNKQENLFYFYPENTAKRIAAIYRYLRRQTISNINIPVKITCFDDTTHAKKIIKAFRSIVRNTDEIYSYSGIVSLLKTINTFLVLQNTSSDTVKEYLRAFSPQDRQQFDMTFIFNQYFQEKETLPSLSEKHCETLRKWLLYKNNWCEQGLSARDNYFFIYKNNQDSEHIYFNAYHVAESIVQAYQLMLEEGLKANRENVLLLLESVKIDNKTKDEELEKEKKELVTKIDTLFQSLSLLQK
jgi:hypothetical protein